MWKRLSEAIDKMGVTFITKCTNCGGYMLSTQKQKTKTCPYCATKVNLIKAQKIASANTAYEASELLRNLKSQKGFEKN